MNQHVVKILKVDVLTSETKKFIVEKPSGYNFSAGQCASLAINWPGLENKKRAYSIASLPNELVLEFIIKSYPEHKEGLSKELHKLKPDDQLLLSDAFGSSLTYKGEGVFVAGGVGVVPFLSVLRQLRNEGKIGNNMLFMSFRYDNNFILENEFRDMFKGNPENLLISLTRESKPGFGEKRFDREFFEKSIKNGIKRAYICGPPSFVKDLNDIFSEMGFEVHVEKF
jgi:ferredoxin-NADP reductase